MYSRLLSFEKCGILMKAFVESQFTSSPLVYNRRLNNKINGLHERALRVVYDVYDHHTFNEFLVKMPFTIHERMSNL